ncbi:IS66 family insertion sequence element accessory protein TnpA, partial [Neolewinella litorea]
MDKASRMYALLDRQATSGKTIKDFCTTEGISYATFHYWRRRRRRRDSPQPEPAVVGRDGFINLRCSPPQEGITGDA